MIPTRCIRVGADCSDAIPVPVYETEGEALRAAADRVAEVLSGSLGVDIDKANGAARDFVQWLHMDGLTL